MGKVWHSDQVHKLELFISWLHDIKISIVNYAPCMVFD